MRDLERFAEQVKNAPDSALLEAFIEQTENGKRDALAYDAAKVVKREILRRMSREDSATPY